MGAATVLKQGGEIYGITRAASILIAGALGAEVGPGSPAFVLLAFSVAALNLLTGRVETLIGRARSGKTGR